MKIGVQMVGFFMPYLMKGESVPFDFAKQALEEVKSIGYKGIQLSGMGTLTEEMITFYKETCKELELEIVVTHIGYKELVENLELVIKAHKSWNCKYCGIGAMPSQFQKNKETYIEFSKEMNKIGEKLKKEGIQFMYHMHAFEFIKQEKEFGLDLIMNNSENQNFKLLLDTYWAQYGGNNIIELIDKYKNRIDIIHLKDMRIVSAGTPHFDLGKQEFSPIGEGTINFIPIIEKLKELNLEWAIVEQDTGFGRDMKDCYLSSYNYLKSIGCNF
ncbi:MAG: sugar phosphate isomerase/epimerase family protein [Fusobacteriaceae bacterium]